MSSNRTNQVREDQKGDTALVAEPRLDNNEAFSLLTKKYIGAMYAVALRIVKSRSAAEDVVQDSFLIAYRSLLTLRNPNRFGAWLYTITRNCALKSKNDNYRENLVPFSECESTYIRASLRIYSELENRWERHEMAKLIRSAIAKLPEKYRMDHERVIRGIIASLEATCEIAEDSHHTGAFKGGIRRGIALYNGALQYFHTAELIDEKLFPALDEDAVFDDIGVACGQLAAYVRGYLGLEKRHNNGPVNIDINELIDGVLGKGNPAEADRD